MALTLEHIRAVVEASAKGTTDNIKADIKTRIDELTSKINTINDNLNSHIVALEIKSTAHEKKLNSIDDRFLRLERQNDIVIRNVPLLENENVSDVFNQICGKIGFNSLCGINPLVFRMRAKNMDKDTASSNEYIRKRLRSASNLSIKPPPIIVKFAVLWEKHSFMKAYFSYAKLSLLDIGYQIATRIYIGDNLTKQNYIILSEAVKLRKKQILSSVFSRNGQIFVSLEKGTSKLVPNLDFLKTLYQQ